MYKKGYFDMPSRYERRQSMAQELIGANIREIQGRELTVPTREPEHTLKAVYNTVFPNVAKPKKQTPHVRNKKVRVTGGDIDASMFPSDKLLDKNGNELTGFAKAKRVERLAKQSKRTVVQDNSNSVTITDLQSNIDALTKVVSGLVSSQMSAIK